MEVLTAPVTTLGQILGQKRSWPIPLGPRSSGKASRHACLEDTPSSLVRPLPHKASAERVRFAKATQQPSIQGEGPLSPKIRDPA